MEEPPSERVMYLHGDLDLKIVEARNLPNMDLATEHLRRCFTLCGDCRSNPPSSSAAARDGDSDGDGVEDKRIDHRAKIITSDPYIKVCVPQATLARTRVIPNAQSPVWNEHFHIPLAHPMANLEFQVKDNDLFGAQIIGRVLIPAERLTSGEDIAGWFPVVGSPKRDTELNLKMKFTPCEQNLLYKHGIAADPESKGVRHTYFPLRKGSDMVLYQDAHVRDECKLLKIELDGDNVYEQGKCWEDLCHAISEAHHLIYIVGWSIYHKVRLIREPTRPLPRGGDLTLGELLKYKSEEGVRVLLLVWDDKTSHDKLFINTAGVMQTHDEETKKFFKHSSVICVLSPRYASSRLSYIKQKIVGTVFTHHQKCVLVDTQAYGNNRKITAFLGGLDLCDGRHDTPEHRLFRDLDTVFRDDYHNPTFPPGIKAPRQPWHDLHCKIDGPAAYDVLLNFEQRWKRATRWTELGLRFKKIRRWHDDALIKIERISWILCPAGFRSPKDNYTSIPEDDPKIWVSKEGDPGNWHVQIFRSIDSGSVKGFPRTVDVAQTQNLICSKNLVIDKSIQTAYIQAIRSAKHFIYIENQYFIGSSYAWPSYKDAGADNLVPMELALKIASKIKAKERFAVYVVIPMWPEGDPTSAAMQEILFWQNQTMQMMYTVVSQELKSMQLADSHPLDYLNFYCLGKREEMPEERAREDAQASSVSDAEKFQRFMIYVHAKGMVVDDEYVIVGSANINQRSLAGTKDTEIAMGAYQPHHTWAQKMQHPHGQIYGYRMSLWAEHLGTVDKSFHEPETLECVKKVNRVAEDNWKRYTDSNFTLLHGHLLKYPVHVDADGKVGPLPGYETFPDVGGKVLGSYSPTIPDVLTT
ncbi:Phospholipase D delta like [Actinidia chinensis var. chinensis]|uniref:Phospholipase D n=1 Tax=Actinidia chinensis var. chinensis TaxID=1590841 RepID=A0A2R6R602_ACTCC|nr:Phospholipase D delta like [Actinidia chinensis var. chinensis]